MPEIAGREAPKLIGLCPEHGEEFYYPLAEGERPTCPCCPRRLILYKRVGPAVARSLERELQQRHGTPSRGASMSESCIPGRVVKIRLRRRRTAERGELVSVACPLSWSKSRLLSYVRSVHPADTAVIVDWPKLGWDHIWIVSPETMRPNPE